MSSSSAVQPEPTMAVGDSAEVRLTFAQVHEAHFSFVWRSARRMGAPEEIVDDVVQEVFVVVHRSLARFAGRSSAKTWLFGIVLNVVRSHRRRLRIKHPHTLGPHRLADPDALTHDGPAPDECASRAESLRLLERLLDELDDDRRAVFVLAELEEMSAPDIADALSLPVNTVYSRLRLARQDFAQAAARHRARDGWGTQ